MQAIIIKILKTIGSALFAKPVIFWGIRTFWTDRTANKIDDKFVDLGEAALEQDEAKIVEAFKALGYEVVKNIDEKFDKNIDDKKDM